MKKSILITGYTGFVGKNLTSYLFENGFQNQSLLGRNTSINYSNIDHIDEEVVIHLAGLAHDLDKKFIEKDYYEANFVKTKQLFDLFLKSETSKTFIFISTVAVINKVNGVFEEKDATNPTTFYGKTKLLAENYLLENLPKEKNVYILRPTMIHGNGNKGNLTLLYNIIKKGIPYPFGNYSNKRSFISIDNFNFIVLKIIENQYLTSGIYHLSDDEAVDTKDIIKIINEVQQKNVKIIKIPKLIIKIIAKLGDLLPLPINSERLEKMTENFIVSNSKIKENLNINLPLSAIDGLRKTIQTFDKK
jgi:nucleoside-diphosphate-sugar epimerase